MNTFICNSSQAEKLSNYLNTEYGYLGEFTTTGSKVVCDEKVDDRDLEEVRAFAKGIFTQYLADGNELATLRAQNAELREAFNQIVTDLEEIKGHLENSHIEMAEDLLGFVIGEIRTLAKYGDDNAK